MEGTVAELLYTAYRESMADSNIAHALNLAELLAIQKGKVLAKDAFDVLNAVLVNEGYCPCLDKKNEMTKCPCLAFRTNGKCGCELFIDKE